MRFQLLNGIQAHRGDRLVPLGDRQQRLLLALLLLAEGQLVTIEQLIEKVWGEPGIRSARRVLSHYASDLRARLGRTASGSPVVPVYDNGYRVVAERDQVDAHRFRDLVKAARPLLGQDDEEATRLLRSALRQWGSDGLLPGEPLLGLPGPGAAGARVRLLEEHRAAVLACLEAELRLGRHAPLVPELQDLVRAWPLDEEATRLLMLAHHRAGRVADALAAYKDLRGRLRDELGNDPGSRVEELQQLILRQDPVLDPPSGAYTLDPSGVNVRSASEIGKNAVRLVTDAVGKGGVGKGGAQTGVSWTRHPAELLELVRTRFADDPDATNALARVEADPVDGAAVTVLERVLVAHLVRDQTFLDDVGRLVEQEKGARANPPSIVADTVKNAVVYHAPVHVSGDFTIS
ncbi:Regulatory protein AfsR [Nonomuraea coxensis DSM 45129]|uniref:Regulatory protein AfsR n=1 Tax=Nonomuraea coxensis DSM 45129 TaxID=1122611 RepID=A0ABX8UFD3_9ACTN|nr:AfsR/SARP family transcriptional regulator [Nonomuraea coxensis]QYC45237.1 Regulatory protein AfsR [Nonomuraea coxensis DSM 45129]